MRLPLRSLATVAGLLALSAAQAADPTHLYLLDGSLTDARGGPSLVADGGTLDATGYSFGSNQGLNVSGVLGAVYTIDLEFSFNAVNGYRRLIDFKNRASDTGLYNLDRHLNFYNLVTGSPSVFSVDTLSRLTVTRDAAGTFTGYVNGVQQIQFADTGSLAVFSAAGQIARFFEDDLAVSGEASAGRVNYIRLYDTALSSGEVAALAAPVPEPQTYALLLTGLLVTAGAARRRKG